MLRNIVGSVVMVALLVFAGCGGTNKADALFQRQIDEVNKLADALEAGAADEEIKALKERLEQTGKEIEDLGLSAEEFARISERYAEELQKAAAGMQKAMMAELSTLMKESMQKAAAHGLDKSLIKSMENIGEGTGQAAGDAGK